MEVKSVVIPRPLAAGLFIAFVLFLFLIAGCAHSPTTSAPVNIEGTWTGEYDSGMGAPPLRMTFNFKSDGQNIGGFIRNDNVQGEWTPIENGKIKGNSISFLTTPLPKSGIPNMKLKYKGKVDGDKVNMTFSIKIRGQSWSGRRRGQSRPKIDEIGSHIRSGEWIVGSARGLSDGVDRLNSLSGEFTIVRAE